MNKVLFIAPHTDDAEIGCGGTISRFIKEGKDVYVMVLSAAFPSEHYIVRQKDVKPEVLFNELKESMKILGVPEQNIIVYQFQVRYLYSFRQDVLNKLLEVKKKINPDLVFIPCGDDIHQDHQVIHKEGLRAFKTTSLLGFEYPWNNIVSRANYFVKIDKDDLKRKIKSIEQYKSQYGRPYMEKDFIEAWAKVRGIQVETEYAESFEAIRLVV